MRTNMVTGVLLVNCEGNKCYDVIKKAKGTIPGVQNAFRTERGDLEADVVINLVARSEEEIDNAQQTIFKLEGVSKVVSEIGAH